MIYLILWFAGSFVHSPLNRRTALYISPEKAASLWYGGRWQGSLPAVQIHLFQLARFTDVGRRTGGPRKNPRDARKAHFADSRVIPPLPSPSPNEFQPPMIGRFSDGRERPSPNDEMKYPLRRAPPLPTARTHTAAKKNEVSDGCPLQK